MNRLYKIFALDKYQTLTLCATLLASVMLIFLFLTQIGLDFIPKPIFILLYITDGMLLWLPGVLLWPRAKWTTPVILLIVSIFLYCNTLYCRTFGSAMNLTMLSLAPTVDGIIIRSALAAVKWYDFLFIIPTLISALAVRIFGKRALSRLPRHFKLLVTVAYVLLTASIHCKIYFGQRKTESRVTSVAEFFSTYQDLNFHLRWHGVWAGYISDFINRCRAFKEMPPDDIEEIRHWSPCDSASVRNISDKNLIFIIVESLNTPALEWERNGRKAMPNLHRLLSDSTAITFKSVLPQTGTGTSSDGQMMYYSGIYPSTSSPMATMAPEGPYPSLAKLFPVNSFEIIGESRTMWNHGITSEAFGFRHIYDKTATLSVKADSLIFDRAKNIIAQSPQPFFSVITTVQMHSPYGEDDAEDAWFSSLPFDDVREKHYLETCAEFDTVLGDFIIWLKKSGLWEKSIIAIASDHNVPHRNINAQMSGDRILFAILNSGLPGFRCDEIVGQIDVFPTIIDVLGQWDNVTWRGFGHSLLRTVPGYAIAHDGTVAGDTIGKSADIARQRRAIELSQEWITATNKDRLIFDNPSSRNQ